MSKMKYTNKKSSVLAAKWLGQPTAVLLASYNKEGTKYRVQNSMAHFCEWIQKTDVQLVEDFKAATDKEQWAKDMGAKLVEWNNALLKDGYAVNSALSTLGNVRAFFTNQCRAVKLERRKLPKQRIATGEHEFSLIELRKMFHYADVRGKAMLSTAVALGWASDDFLELKRKEIENFVNKAVAEKQSFIAFAHIRGKTGAVSRTHLTPEAIESLRAYLEVTLKDAEFLWSNGSKDTHLTNDTLNNILKDLVQKAGVQTTGSVHFHLLRKFTMSALSGAGIGDWDVKYLIGKEVPADIATYLTNRKEVLMEEFQKAYPKLSLTGYANSNHSRLEEVAEENTKLKEQMSVLWATLDATMKALEEKDEKRKAKMAEIRKVIMRERAKHHA